MGPTAPRVATDRLVAGHSPVEWAVLARYRTSRRLVGAVAGRRLAEAAKRYVDTVHGTTGSHAEVRTRILDTVEVDPACVVHFPFPADWPDCFRRSKAFDARVRHRLRDVVVSPLSGLTWTPSGRVLGESIGSAHRLLGWGNVAHELLFPVSRERLTGPLVCAVSRNYGHWLFDCLPNVLEAVDAHPDVTVLIPALPKDRPPFIEESLRAALGDARFEAMVRHATQPHRVDELILTAMPVDPYFVHPAVLGRLQATFTPDRTLAAGHRDLYVSRRRSPKRRMDNEEAVESLLQRQGFDIVQSEDLSFTERTRVFGQARTVVGPHGAGLANIAWCPPGTTVVELLPPTNFNDYYARVSAMADLSYGFVQARPGIEPGGSIALREVEAMLDDRSRARRPIDA